MLYNEPMVARRLVATVLLLPAFLPCFAQSPDLSKKLDYTTKAVPLSKALAELSEQAGAHLTVSPALANEIVVLRLKGVTTDEAMKKIAQTVGAEWIPENAGFELTRSDDLAAKLKEKALQAKAAAITKMIAQQLKQSGADTPFTADDATKLASQYESAKNQQQAHQEDWQAFQTIEKSMPDARAVWLLLAKIDPRVLGGMESGQRLVFSNLPNAMQLPIAADVSAIGAQLQADHNLLAAALKKLEKPGAPHEVYEVNPSNPMPAITRLVIAIHLQFLAQTYSVQVLGFDASNKPVFATNASLDVAADYGSMMADRARQARTAESEPDLPVTPITQLMLTFMKSSMGGGDRSQPATGDLRTAFLNPDKDDPLSYVFSEAFIGMAERRNENLVAYADDSDFLLGMFAGMEGRLKPSLVLQAVSGLGAMIPTTVSEEDGWMLVSPLDPIEAVETRAARPELGELLRGFDQNGYVTLESASKVATSVRTREFPVLDMFLPMMIDPSADMQTLGDVTLLKLYGSLDEGQMARLTSNQAIRMAELRPEQVATISSYVYESSRMGDGLAYGPDTTYAQAMANSEATETSPNGLSNDSTLMMNGTYTTAYFVKIRMDSTTFTQVMDASNLGYYAYLTKHPDSNPSYHPTVLSIQRGRQRNIQFVVGISPGNNRRGEIKENRMVSGGPWTLDNLPDDLKKQVDKAMKPYLQTGPQVQGDPTPVPTTAPPAN